MEYKCSIKSKKLLCIDTEILKLNNFPKVIKDFILDGLNIGEEVIIFSDNKLYKDLESIFYLDKKLIHNCLELKKLKIKVYNPAEINEECINIKDILEEIKNSKLNIRVIWDFKSILKRASNLVLVHKCVQTILNNSNENIKNLVYINNLNYNYNLLEEFCKNFDDLFIVDRCKEIKFSINNEIGKILWMLQSNAQLKYKNSTLLLFNDMFSTIPKTYDRDKFKNVIMNKLKDICNVDFCILYNYNKEKSDKINLDSFFGLTKKHKYYLMNDNKIIKNQQKLNSEIIEYGKYVLLNDEELKNIDYKNMGITSCIGICLEYYDVAKGVIWVGRYDSNKKLKEQDVEYIEPICKTAYYLIQEQNRFTELQNKLILNEKLRAMGEMAAGIAHDINNVLTPIIGSIQLLKDNVKDKNVLKQLKIIEICAHDGINITDKVKNISRQYNNENKIEVFTIDELILDAINLTKNKWLTESAIKGININVVPILDSRAKVKGDATEIREVFINIIRNAIDAMPKGGKIEIHSYNLDDSIIIEIKDNGIGMNDEVKKRLFEPFFTTKGIKGSGLGLSVSYKIIESHGGSIKVESKENLGTCFTITLPISNEVNNYKSEFIHENINFKGDILIIDDQQQIRNVVADMVKSVSNSRVKTCGASNIKKELMRREYDIVISDFSMPEINGLQIANLVKNKNKNVYFCLMTGWIGNFDKSKIKDVDFILNKPINKEKLKQLFIKYNDRKNKE